MAQVAFILNDQLVPTDHPERQALLASAYRTRTRPLCGCKDPGLPSMCPRWTMALSW